MEYIQSPAELLRMASGLGESQILALDTVDGVFVGPSDLSMLRGRGNFAFREEDRADFRSIASAARKAGACIRVR